jgi:hypothetical protein
LAGGDATAREGESELPQTREALSVPDRGNEQRCETEKDSVSLDNEASQEPRELEALPSAGRESEPDSVSLADDNESELPQAREALSVPGRGNEQPCETEKDSVSLDEEALTSGASEAVPPVSEEPRELEAQPSAGRESEPDSVSFAEDSESELPQAREAERDSVSFADDASPVNADEFLSSTVPNADVSAVPIPNADHEEVPMTDRGEGSTFREGAIVVASAGSSDEWESLSEGTIAVQTEPIARRVSGECGLVDIATEVLFVV